MRSGANRSVTAPALVIGFAFSGLFDGILLHQLLQWHHLLSLVDGEPFRDVRVQIFADGAFHITMYAVAALGVWLLWRARSELAAPGTGRRFTGGVLLGFGAWNVVDAVVFHWVLRIHHIRLDPDEALLSDVLWLAALGVLPLLLGWLLGRISGGGAGPPARSPALFAAIAIMGAGALSLAPRDDPMTAVLFRPGVADVDVMRAVAAVDGRLVWSDSSGDVVVIRLDKPAARWALYRYGALLVGGAGPAGCLGWSRAA